MIGLDIHHWVWWGHEEGHLPGLGGLSVPEPHLALHWSAWATAQALGRARFCPLWATAHRDR